MAGIVPQNTPERATGHPWAFSDAGARVGPALGATGHSGRPFADVDLLRHYVDRGRDGPVIDAEWREYGFAAPVVTRGTQTVKRYRRNKLGPGVASAAAVEIETRAPHHAPSASSDVFVPLAQAVITAALVTLLCGVLAVIAGRDDALRIVGVAFVVTLCAAWAWRLGIVTSLLQTVERITQELDGDDAPDDAETHLMAVQPKQARQTVATETRQRFGR